jgi:Rrf2 family protein
MMRINRRTDYAIRVLLALAKKPPGTRLSTHAIQKMMLVPRAFLLRIIADLSKANLIETYPGPRGGLELSRDPSEINLRTVWEALEGPLVISECVASPEECPLSEGCPVNSLWARIQRLVLAELEDATLTKLAAEALHLDALVTGR